MLRKITSDTLQVGAWRVTCETVGSYFPCRCLVATSLLIWTIFGIDDANVNITVSAWDTQELFQRCKAIQRFLSRTIGSNSRKVSRDIHPKNWPLNLAFRCFSKLLHMNSTDPRPKQTTSMRRYVKYCGGTTISELLWFHKSHVSATTGHALCVVGWIAAMFCTAMICRESSLMTTIMNLAIQTAAAMTATTLFPSPFPYSKMNKSKLTNISLILKHNND